MYEYADKQIKAINRHNLYRFEKLKTLKFDSLNVFRQVTAVYEESIRFCKKKYKQIAWDAYIAAYLFYKGGFMGGGVTTVPYPQSRSESKKPSKSKEIPAELREEAEKKAEKKISDRWLNKILEEADPVVMYRFESEAQRKKDRLVEALIAAHVKSREIDKALRLWTLQVAHYADKSVDRATLQAYSDLGVKNVVWVTMEDEKVCAECAERDGNVYPIDEVPPKPHIRCRCELRHAE